MADQLLWRTAIGFTAFLRFLTEIRCCENQWWSLETWSRSRDSSRDPFLRVSVSKVSDLVFVSVSKVSGLETLNSAKKWFIKISKIQIFCLLYLQVRNNQNMSEKCQKLEKIQVRSTGVRRNVSRGASSIFCLSSPCCWRYNANARSQNALPFLHYNVNSPATQGRNEGGKGDTIPRAPNHFGDAIKFQQCPKDLRFKHRGAKPASCPGRHLTSLRPCCYGSSRKNRASFAQQCFFFIHACFHTAQYKTTKLITISSHCLAAFSAKDVCVQQSHAAKRLRP